MMLPQHLANLPLPLKILLCVGLVVLFVYQMMGLAKVHNLLWKLSPTHKIYFSDDDEDHTYSSYELNIMRLFIVLTLIQIVSRLVGAFWSSIQS